MPNKPRSASFWQNKLSHDPSSSLGSLFAQAEKLSRYQEIVRHTLDKNCQEHCWLAGYHHKILYLQSDTAAWATRIRMHQHTMTKQLRRHAYFQDIGAMRIRVRPRNQKPAPKIKAKPLSDITLAHIRQTSADINDSSLRSAMEKLAD